MNIRGYPYEILAETESTAVTSLRIVNDFASPCLYHSDKDIRIFSSADTLGREHLGIVASDMLHDAKRAPRMDIDKFMLRLRGDEIAVFVDQVAGVDEDFRFGEFEFAGLPKIFAHLCLQFRKLAPSLHRLAVESEGGDTGADIVFIAVFRHQCELTCYDCHRCFLRDGIRVIGNASACRMMLCLKYILAQFLSGNLQEGRLGSREKLCLMQLRT